MLHQERERERETERERKRQREREREREIQLTQHTPPAEADTLSTLKACIQRVEGEMP